MGLKIGFFGKMVLGKSKSTIQRLVKENRLEFIGDNKLIFTDRQGKKQTLLFKDFFTVLPDTTAAGVGPDEIEKLVIEEYHKSKAYTGGLKERK